MKRKSEAPMELPLLEIVFLPGDPVPVSVVVAGDFMLSGDISISMGATKIQLIEMLPILSFAMNHVADKLIEMVDRDNPPFVPTGRAPSKESSTE